MAKPLVKRKMLRPDQAAQTSPEYSVYIYHRPGYRAEGLIDWERRAATNDLGEAMTVAQLLSRSRSYKKIEIMRRVVDPQTRTAKDYLFKRFAPTQNHNRFYWGLIAVSAALWMVALV